MATEEDQKYRIDYWARLFKATTWEDISMLAQSDVNLKEAAETVYVISQDELIREQMIAREDNIRSEKAMKKHYEDAMEEARLDKIRSENAMKKHYEDAMEEARLDKIRSENAMKKHYEDAMEEANRSKKAMEKHYEDLIADQQKQIEELKAALASK